MMIYIFIKEKYLRDILSYLIVEFFYNITSYLFTLKAFFFIIISHRALQNILLFLFL